MLFDLPLEALEDYRPEVACPEDFGAFWDETLSEARSHPLGAVFTPIDVGLQTLQTFDVSFAGFGGQAVKGWLLLPVGQEPLACVVEYIGYGGGRGSPVDWLFWSSAGYAHFIMDTRGQGSAWLRGDTPDSGGDAEPHYPGFMTRGIASPEGYYYRRLITDACRAVEAARAHPAVNPERVAAAGMSQGGGVTLAVAGLLPELWAALPDVPFLCHFRRATTLIDSHPYAEIRNYLKVHRDKVAAVYRTLSYFDGVNFAARSQTPALFSVALMDDVCPPSTIYAAYNRYAGEKDIRVYEFNNHEGGQSVHKLEQLRFLRALG